jgi:prolipoprotein diacylglyceryltransferase
MSVPVGAPRNHRLPRRYLFRALDYRVPSYTAMLYVGCTVGVYAGVAVAGAAGLDQSRVAVTMIVLLVPALAGARLLYVLQHLERYRADPRRVWRRSEGGAALYGGLVVCIPLSAPVLAWVGLPFWAFWDAAVVTMLVGLVFTRVGCLLNVCCAGRPTTGPLGVRLPGRDGIQRRFPTQILEAAWGAVVLGAALLARPALPVSGALFAVVIAAYAAGRLVLEPLREQVGARWAPATNVALSIGLLIAACAVLLVRFAG